MATIFPSSPTIGDQYAGYEWNGTAWIIIGIDLTQDYATQTELDTHTTASTSVHGISDTSALATQTYADNAATTAAAGIVDAAPATLDTLNELAAALGDDPNFATTITNSLSTKVTGDGITDIVALTQAEYDALTPNATTLYVVTD